MSYLNQARRESKKRDRQRELSERGAPTVTKHAVGSETRAHTYTQRQRCRQRGRGNKTKERETRERPILESSVTKTAKISRRLPTIIPIFVSIVRRGVCLRFRFHPFTTCNWVALLVTQNLSAVTQRERASVNTALAWRWAVIWTLNMVLASPFQPKLDC